MTDFIANFGGSRCPDCSLSSILCGPSRLRAFASESGVPTMTNDCPDFLSARRLAAETGSVTLTASLMDSL